MSSTARRPHDYRQRRFRPEAHENSGSSHPLTTRSADSSYPRRAQRRRWNLARLWPPAGPPCPDPWQSHRRRKTAALSSADRTESCGARSEEHTSELQALMRKSYDVFFMKTNQTGLLHNAVQPDIHAEPNKTDEIEAGKR